MIPVICLAWFCIFQVTADETCVFPEFLQSTPAEGPLKPWTTRIWWLYLRHSPKWAEKQDIYVKNGQIWRHRETNQPNCENAPMKVYHKTSFGECSQRQLVYNRTCIREEYLNTYRVIEYNVDRTHRFTCMKFVKRSNNVVQVYEGSLSNINDPGLCDSSGLRLDEWPWTAPWSNEPSHCALNGGFSFRTIRRLTNEDLCEEEWRSSVLEIECIKGDGMVFMAPKHSNCNPFLKHGDRKRLVCMATWEHGDYIFTIASDEGNQPRYCLRFPRLQQGEFSVLVYFSVICPTEQDGKPPPGIEYYELRMFRKDKTSCRDESEDNCMDIITTLDMCTKDLIHAPHCPKTCGRCSMSTVSGINGRRCWIDPNLYGDWHLIDAFRNAEVTIDKEKAAFSHLGAFQCLHIDNKGRRYKMASLFDNGCSARYTCMEFIRRNNNVLQYRISPSQRTEEDMDNLCVFKDDPPPLLDSYRNEHFKNLILTKDLWPSYCGLQSMIPFNGTIGGNQCAGVISDWNEEKCNLLGTISLKSRTCDDLTVPLEYQCIAFIQDDAVPLQQVLLTRSLDGRDKYNCWVIASYAGGGQWPVRVMYQMPTAQCSLGKEVDRLTSSSYTAALTLNDKARTKTCKPTESRQKMAHSELSEPAEPDISYIIPNQDQTANEVHVENRSPKSPPVENPPSIDSTVLPFWGMYGQGNVINAGIFYKQIICVLFLQMFNIFLRNLLYR